MKNIILRILAGIILLSLISGIVVLITGLRLGWETSTQFSDGLFWASGIMILIGFVSYRGYSLAATNGPPVHLDPTDRAKLWTGDAFRGKIFMAVFGISGLMLFGLSILISRLF